MSDVIEFLQKMGQDAQLRHGSQDDLEQALAAAGLAGDLNAAILSRRPSDLEAFMQQAPVCGYFLPGKEDEEEGGEDEDDEGETPSREPESASAVGS
jgi:hypothetical protein